MGKLPFLKKTTLLKMERVDRYLRRAAILVLQVEKEAMAAGVTTVWADAATIRKALLSTDGPEEALVMRANRMANGRGA